MPKFMIAAATITLAAAVPASSCISDGDCRRAHAPSAI